MISLNFKSTQLNGLIVQSLVGALCLAQTGVLGDSTELQRARTLESSYQVLEQIHVRHQSTFTQVQGTSQSANAHYAHFIADLETLTGSGNEFKAKIGAFNRALTRYRNSANTQQESIQVIRRNLDQDVNIALSKKQNIIELNASFSNRPTMAELYRTINLLKGTVRELDTTTARVEETNRLLKETTDNIQTTTESFNQTTLGINNTINRLRNFVGSFERSINQIETSNAVLTTNNESLGSTNSALETSINQLTVLGSEMSSLLTTLQPEMEKLRENLDAISIQVRNISQTIGAFRQMDQSLSQSILDQQLLVNSISDASLRLLANKILNDLLSNQNLLRITLEQQTIALEIAEHSANEATAAHTTINSIFLNLGVLVSKINGASGLVQQQNNILNQQKEIATSNSIVLNEQRRIILTQRALWQELIGVIQSLELIRDTQQNLVDAQRRIVQRQYQLESEQNQNVVVLRQLLTQQNQIIRDQEALLVPRCTQLSASSTTLAEGNTFTLSVAASGFLDSVLIDGTPVSSIGGSKLIRATSPGRFNYAASVVGAINKETIQCGSVTVTVTAQPDANADLAQRLANARELCTPADLEELRRNPGGDFKLVCNIDMAQEPDWKPIESFGGMLYGQGHSIANLHMTGVKRMTFIYVIQKEARISNLKLSNLRFVREIGSAGHFDQNTGDTQGFVLMNYGTLINIAITGTIMSDHATGFAGYNRGTIIGSSFSGTVNAVNTMGFAYNNSGTIENCFVRADLKGFGVYGFIQINSNDSAPRPGTLKNSYFRGNIETRPLARSEFYSGMHGGAYGFAVFNGGRITNCYSAASYVRTTTQLIPFLGTNYDNGSDRIGIVTNSYYNATASRGNPNLISNSFGIPKSVSAMRNQATFAGWDFDRIWKMSDGRSFPDLR